MAANFPIPPTYADPILKDARTGEAIFNPLWLQWFLDVARVFSVIGATGSGVPHNNLSGIQGGLTAERYHLTAAEHSNIELTTHKDAASGYAGLNGVSRTTKGVITIDDLIVDNSAKGLVLKDTQVTPHYWLVKVSTLGMLTTTDLGTTAP